MTRKLATIRRIDKITPIEGADAIECAHIGGWKVVIRKGEYQEGDLAIYLEIDSWVPTDLAPFLSKGKEPKEFEGIKGERLRTVKLRGQLSQGLLIPIPTIATDLSAFEEGDDVTDILGVLKFERAIPAQLAGVIRSTFPSFVPKTDQERVQNLKMELEEACKNGVRFEVLEKLEGSSMTAYLYHGDFGVCSRNLDLKRVEGTTFWDVAIREGIEEKMKSYDEFWDFAIQGELIGPNVQGNIYGLKQHEFHVFDVYDIQQGKYLEPASRRALVTKLGLKHVPVLFENTPLGTGDINVDQVLEWAEGKSELADTEREGLVFNSTSGDNFGFKAISNKYLLKEK